MPVRTYCPAANRLAIALPADLPEDQQAWRLNPPVTASTSSTSPVKYNPGTSFDSNVSGETSEVATPHAVTNSSPGRCPQSVSGIHDEKSFTKDRRASFETVAAFVSGESPESPGRISAKRLGKNFDSTFFNSFAPSEASASERSLSQDSKFLEASGTSFTGYAEVSETFPNANLAESAKTAGQVTPKCVNMVAPSERARPSLSRNLEFGSERPEISEHQDSNVMNAESDGAKRVTECPSDFANP